MILRVSVLMDSECSSPVQVSRGRSYSTYLLMYLIQQIFHLHQKSLPVVQPKLVVCIAV